MSRNLHKSIGLNIENRAMTIALIREIIFMMDLPYPDSPRQNEVLCIFTDKPIGDEEAFDFVMRKGNWRSMVLCLASCEVKSDKYVVVVPPKNEELAHAFMNAVRNMRKIRGSRIRSLFSLEPSSAPKIRRRRRSRQRIATNRRPSPRQLIAAR